MIRCIRCQKSKYNKNCKQKSRGRSTTQTTYVFSTISSIASCDMASTTGHCISSIVAEVAAEDTATTPFIVPVTAEPVGVEELELLPFTPNPTPSPVLSITDETPPPSPSPRPSPILDATDESSARLLRRIWWSCRALVPRESIPSEVALADAEEEMESVRGMEVVMLDMPGEKVEERVGEWEGETVDGKRVCGEERMGEEGVFGFEVEVEGGPV
jgi:hypothetical protein